MTKLIINPDFFVGVFNEKKIDEYKVFYKEHLMKLSFSQRMVAIERLSKLQLDYTKKEPGRGTFLNQELMMVNIESQKTIKELFGDIVLSLFNKNDIPVTKTKTPERLPDNIILGLLVSFAFAINDYSEKMKQEWNYRKNFISFLIDCIREYGLHSNILLRPENAKRYNVSITHYYRSRQSIIEKKYLLTAEQFNLQFSIPYSKKQPLKFIGKLIPFDKIYEVKITTTFLKDDELELFALKNKFKWNDTYKDIDRLVETCLDETELYHPNPFDLELINSEPDKYMLEQTARALRPFPASQKLFKKAIKKYNEGNIERNILDDLRLSLELLLKEILENEKSLENQSEVLGKWLKLKESTPEIRNLFSKLLEGYNRYQNNYVKHNDMVPKQEISFMIDLSTTFLKHIVSLH